MAVTLGHISRPMIHVNHSGVGGGSRGNQSINFVSVPHAPQVRYPSTSSRFGSLNVGIREPGQSINARMFHT